MKKKAKFITILLFTLVFMFGSIIGYFVPDIFIKIVIEKFSIEYFIKNDFSMPFHTFTTYSYENLIGSSVSWTKKYLDENISQNIEKKVRKKYSYRYDTAIKGINSDDDILEYFKKINLIKEIGLNDKELTDKLANYDTKTTIVNSKSNFTKAYMNLSPHYNVRLPAEYEPIESVFVSYPIYYPSQWKTHMTMIRAISKETLAVVLVPDQFWHKAVILYLQQNNLDMKNICFAYVKTDDVWIRDFGPTTVIKDNGNKTFIWNNYYEKYTSYAKLSADAACELGRYYDVPVYRVPLVVEGGNIITDGKGTIIMFDSVLKNNPDYNREKLEKVMNEYYGCKRLILLPSLKGELTGHIDMAVKYINNDTLMVIQSEKSYHWYNSFENIADILSNTKSSSGFNYKIIRMKMASTDNNSEKFCSYINSLTVNGSVIVPVFGAKEDDAALELYKKAMPGYKVVGVNMSNYPVGSVHCQTKEMYK